MIVSLGMWHELLLCDQQHSAYVYMLATCSLSLCHYVARCPCFHSCPILCIAKHRQMLVQWTTKDSSNPVVKWGQQPGAYTHTARANSSTYTMQDMCGPPANSIGWVEPGTFHAALLKGLEPGMQYYYVVGDEVRQQQGRGSGVGIVLMHSRGKVLRT